MTNIFIFKNIRVNYVILLLLTIFLILRFTFPVKETESTTENINPVEKITKIKSKILQPKPFNHTITLYGSAIPFQESIIVSKTSGYIGATYRKQGDFINEGEIILSIESTGLNEQYISKKLELKKSELEYKSALNLKKSNLISELSLMQTKADLENVRAEYILSESKLNDSIIKANFSGIIEDFDLKKGDYISQGQKIGTLNDISKFRVYINVPEKYITDIKSENDVIFKFPKKDILGKINYIAKVGDKSTHTFKVEVISNQVENIFIGLTTPTVLSLGIQQAYSISPSYINSDPKGDLYIKGVENKKVKHYYVNILNSDENGIWISGDKEPLPSEINFITLGHLLVKEGDIVDAILEENN